MTTFDAHFELTQLAEQLAIVRLAAEASISAWATGGALFSIRHTADKLSIVVPARHVRDRVADQEDGLALKVHGPFALWEIGVLSALTAPLADAKISVFAISTSKQTTCS